MSLGGLSIDGSLQVDGPLLYCGSLRLDGTLWIAGSLCNLGALIGNGSLLCIGALPWDGSLWDYRLPFGSLARSAGSVLSTFTARSAATVLA
jgi:hypothetical protein